MGSADFRPPQKAIDSPRSTIEGSSSVSLDLDNVTIELESSAVYSMTAGSTKWEEELETSIPYHFSEDEMVMILVGKQEKPFYAHKKLLQDKVPYFSACLKECWMEDKNESVRLAHINEQGFRGVIRWLYSGELPPDLASKCETDQPGAWRALEIIYKTADQLLMPGLQNALIDAHITAMGRHSWPLYKAQKVSDLELRHTPYYRMVLKSAVRNFMNKGHDDVKDSLTSIREKEILEDIIEMVDLYNREPWGRLSTIDRCQFYLQDKGADTTTV